MTLIIELDPELEAGLRASAERAGIPPDRFVLGLLHERLTPVVGPAGLGRVESELLQRIGEGLPPATWTRYQALKEKRNAGTLTDAEHAELIRLVNEVEIWNARRMEAVAELARLRGVRFPDLVQELALGVPVHV